MKLGHSCRLSRKTETSAAIFLEENFNFLLTVALGDCKNKALPLVAISVVGRHRIGRWRDFFVNTMSRSNFLLTGQPPFAGRSAVQVLAAHLYEQPAPLADHRADLPAELQAVVLRCLAKNPPDRFADVHSLAEALATCQGAGL